MSYRIYAHKGGKSLSIPVEEKHKYYNNAISENYPSGDMYIRTYPSTSSANKYSIQVNKINAFHSTNAFTTATGVDVDNRIGDKVMLNKIDCTLAIRMNNQVTGGDGQDYANLYPYWINLRLMVVHFDTSQTIQNIANWFRDTYIYYNDLGNNNLRQSCHQKMLRESCQHTGKFKILFDERFKLSRNDPVRQMKVSISPNMDLTFDSNNTVTNADFKNTYFILFGPIDYSIDCSTYLGNWLLNTSNKTYDLVNFTYNIKYTYYDLN